MISKEEAIKRLKEARFTVQPYLYMNEAFDVAIEAISQPERPKGRWVERVMRFGEHCQNTLTYYICSECECCSGNVTSYCHNCGADMRGEEE